MRLELKRPIVFFDLETTGINVETDKIVQIALLKVYPDNKEEMLNLLVNPGIPIPPLATSIHGITDEDVANEPKFQKRAEEILEFLMGCDISGFNIHKFDLPFLRFEFQKVGIVYDITGVEVIDPQVIYHKKEPRNLEAAYKQYCGKDLEGAHDAEVDIRATKEVFMAQVEKYNDIGESVAEVAAFSNYSEHRPADISGKLLLDEDGDLIYNFGKHKGTKVKDELSFAKWMYNKDFPADTKELLRPLLKDDEFSF